MESFLVNSKRWPSSYGRKDRKISRKKLHQVHRIILQDTLRMDARFSGLGSSFGVENSIWNLFQFNLVCIDNLYHLTAAEKLAVAKLAIKIKIKRRSGRGGFSGAHLLASENGMSVFINNSRLFIFFLTPFHLPRQQMDRLLERLTPPRQTPTQTPTVQQELPGQPISQNSILGHRGH